MLNEIMNVKVEGHLKIWEEESGKILLDQHNAIHPENMSIAIANSLSNNDGFIKELVLGNGGVRVNANSEYLYQNPQTINRTATLYNETYSKVVDQYSALNTNKERNFMKVSHVSGNTYSDIMIQCALEKNEPEGQTLLNQNNEIIGEYTFSEAGLRDEQDNLITHLCFSPINKNSSISLIFNYLLRIRMV